MNKFFSFVKIEHTLFTLPLIYSGLLLGLKEAPNWQLLVLVLLSATGAFVGVVGAAGGRLVAERMMRTGESVAPAPAAVTQTGRST